jgi:hypothetical protein
LVSSGPGLSVVAEMMRGGDADLHQVYRILSVEL